MARSAPAYVAGKALVYTAVGLAVILARQALAQAMVPVVQVARQVLGPLMILLALYLFL
jgi:sorbitol-specific phosphotransferase system component IIBC